MKAAVKLFDFRGSLNKRTASLFAFAGTAMILVVWESIVRLGLIQKTLMPTPSSVVSALGEMVSNDNLVSELMYSLKLNLIGYIEAVLVAVPIGFAISLFASSRAAFNGVFAAMRFLPLAALTGPFIAWFGIDDTMKIQFLAFSIIVYLVPVAVQCVDDVDQVHVDMAKTLGASKWQTIKWIFFPGAMSKMIDYIRVIVATSWTYIIIAEVINKNAGIGALISTVSRQNRIDKVFAGVLVIAIVGMLQDLAFMMIDKTLYPFKYTKGEK